MRDRSREHVELDNDDLNFPARADEKRLHVAGKWSTSKNSPRNPGELATAASVERSRHGASSPYAAGCYRDGGRGAAGRHRQIPVTPAGLRQRRAWKEAGTASAPVCGRLPPRRGTWSNWPAPTNPRTPGELTTAAGVERSRHGASSPYAAGCHRGGGRGATGRHRQIPVPPASLRQRRAWKEAGTAPAPRTRQAATAAGDVEQPAGTDISP